jgi:hypothetical protein
MSDMQLDTPELVPKSLPDNYSNDDWFAFLQVEYIGSWIQFAVWHVAVGSGVADEFGWS